MTYERIWICPRCHAKTTEEVKLDRFGRPDQITGRFPEGNTHVGVPQRPCHCGGMMSSYGPLRPSRALKPRPCVKAKGDKQCDS